MSDGRGVGSVVPLFGAIPGGPELFILFLVGVMVLVIPLGLAYWVYRDATERGDDDVTLWTLAVVVAGVIVPLFGAVGVGILYVLVGRG